MQLFLILLLVPVLASVASAAAASADLDSTQQRTLVDAEYYVKETERAMKPILAKAEGLNNGTSPLSEQQLQGAMNEVNHAGLKLNNALQRLAQLPGDEPSVAAMSKRAADLATTLLACEQVFKSAGEKKQEAINAAGDIEKDIKRLDAASLKIANGDFLTNYPDRELPTVLELDRLVAFRNEMAERYAPVLEDFVGREMKNTISGFDYRLEQYREAMQRVAVGLPARIRQDFEQAQTICDTSVERKRAQTFTEGVIEATFARAQVNLDLLEAISGKTPESKALATEKTNAEQKIAAAAKSLETEILTSNTPPNDVYGAGDKAEIIAHVEKAWKKSSVKGEVLAMRIPMQAWERSEGIRWAHDRYELHDFSQIQVAISVKASADRVHNYYALLEKDHLKGDKIRVRIDDKGEVPLYRQILMSNWK